MSYDLHMKYIMYIYIYKVGKKATACLKQVCIISTYNQYIRPFVQHEQITRLCFDLLMLRTSHDSAIQRNIAA